MASSMATQVVRRHRRSISRKSVQLIARRRALSIALEKLYCHFAPEEGRPRRLECVKLQSRIYRKYQRVWKELSIVILSPTSNSISNCRNFNQPIAADTPHRHQFSRSTRTSSTPSSMECLHCCRYSTSLQR